MASNPRVEDLVELLSATRLRTLVTTRRVYDPTSLPARQASPERQPSDPLEGLIAQIEAHRRLLWFDVESSIPLIGPLLTAFKRLQRRVMRSYVVQQDAFNNFVLAFLHTLALEQRREGGSDGWCDGSCQAVSGDRAGNAAIPGGTDLGSSVLLLRRRFDAAPVDVNGAALIDGRRGLAGLAPFFASCHLVLGAGPGVERCLASLRANGTDGLKLARCPACQDSARRRGVRVADADLWEYFAAPDAVQADGFLFAHIVERLPYSESVRLLKLASRTLAPGKPLVLVTSSTSTYVSRALEEQAPDGLRVYSLEFLAQLSAACGFEVVGASFL